jgi:uncharacterized GH25 family protein
MPQDSVAAVAAGHVKSLSGERALSTSTLVFVLAALAPSANASHDMWIVPPAAAPGELAEVRLQEGHLTYPVASPRDNHHLSRFAAVGPSGEELAVAGLEGADPAGVFRPGVAGLWTVVYQSVESFSMLPPELFNADLEEKGLDAILELRRRRGEDGDPGRELYSRSLKSLFRVGSAAAADRAVGLPLELVIETEPKLWPAGALRLRLLLRGAPLAGALVEVQSFAGGARAAARRTDGEGHADFELGPGTWMASVTYMESVTDMEAETASPRADWRSLFAVLTWVIDSPREPVEPGRLNR